MTTYYKAVRPNGTDFATGTTRPVIGEWMLRIDGRLRLCERGYHVSDAPGETLIGGSWPCRLFEVEIREGVPPTYIKGHKRVVHTYRPIREVPAWQALGPNGKAVAALIERAHNLTPDEIHRLAAAEKRYAVGYLVRNTARKAARDAVWDAVWNAVWDASWNGAWNAVWDAVWDAVGDAMWALLVRDLIAPEHFNVLYGSWASAIGEPAYSETA